MMLLALGGVILAGVVSALNHPGNRQAGAMCRACHGPDGAERIPGAPSHPAESVIYIESQLKAFRSGKRRHNVMSEIAAGLGDEEIRAAAEWYSSIGFDVEPRAAN